MPKRRYIQATRPAANKEELQAQPPEAGEAETVCAICSRPLAGICNRHHLIPLSKGGRGTTTLLLHKICHDKIHSVFSEVELKRYYHTTARLQEGEEMAAFIRWVQKKEPEFYDRSVKSWERRAT